MTNEAELLRAAYKYVMDNAAGALRNADWSLLDHGITYARKLLSGEAPIPEDQNMQDFVRRQTAEEVELTKLSMKVQELKKKVKRLKADRKKQEEQVAFFSVRLQEAAKLLFDLVNGELLDGLSGREKESWWHRTDVKSEMTPLALWERGRYGEVIELATDATAGIQWKKKST